MVKSMLVFAIATMAIMASVWFFIGDTESISISISGGVHEKPSPIINHHVHPHNGIHHPSYNQHADHQHYVKEARLVEKLDANAHNNHHHRYQHVREGGLLHNVDTHTHHHEYDHHTVNKGKLVHKMHHNGHHHHHHDHYQHHDVKKGGLFGKMDGIAHHHNQYPHDDDVRESKLVDKLNANPHDYGYANNQYPHDDDDVREIKLVDKLNGNSHHYGYPDNHDDKYIVKKGGVDEEETKYRWKPKLQTLMNGNERTGGGRRRLGEVEDKISQKMSEMMSLIRKYIIVAIVAAIIIAAVIFLCCLVCCCCG